MIGFCKDVTIFINKEEYLVKKLDTLKINSIYNHEKITGLFNNSDTMSFIDLVIDYKKLLTNGYNKRYLDQSLTQYALFAIFPIFNDCSCSNINIAYIEKVREL